VTVAQLRNVEANGVHYQALAFVCPGCILMEDDPRWQRSGLHLLPVNTNGVKTPQWTFDGNLEAPTLSPSILSSGPPYSDSGKPLGRCHSFIEHGMIRFLDDCTHPLKGQTVPLPELPDWFVHETEEG
jgi:hypothetical protein